MDMGFGIFRFGFFGPFASVLGHELALGVFALRFGFFAALARVLWFFAFRAPGTFCWGDQFAFCFVRPLPFPGENSRENAASAKTTGKEGGEKEGNPPAGILREAKDQNRGEERSTRT